MLPFQPAALKGESGPELIFHQNWSESVRRSTWRELKPVCLALLPFASPLCNSKVFWYSDNQNVESILRDGSRKRDLQDLALVVFQIFAYHCISFEVKWVPRDLNASADCILLYDKVCFLFNNTDSHISRLAANFIFQAFERRKKHS